MSAQHPNGGGSLASASDIPPPGPGLRAAVQTMEAVRTRVPLRTLALITGVMILMPVVFLLRGTRRDLAALPAAWVVGMAIAWTLGLLVSLLPAVLPRKGEVLPDAGRAARFAGFAGFGLMLLGLFATVNAPGITRIPEANWAAFSHGWSHCIASSLAIIAPVLLVGALALRRVFPVGETQAGAALGAAGGTAAGLTLHFTCGIGGGLHVGLAHAGAIAVGALLGMLLLHRPLRS